MLKKTCKVLLGLTAVGSLLIMTSCRGYSEGLPSRTTNYSIKDAPAPWRAFGYSYVGLTVGYGTANLKNFVDDFGDVSGKDDGFLYGAYIGYMFRPRERLGLGIEVDYTRTDYKKDFDVSDEGPPVLERLRSNWNASVRARAGVFLAPPAFLYATGGVAFSDRGDPGPVWGGGLELALTNTVMARVEGLRYEGDNEQTVGRLGLGFRLN